MSLSDWRLLDDDPVLGIRRWFAYDSDRDETHIKTQHYHTGRLLDQNGQEKASTSGEKFGEFRKVASIPLNVYYDSGYAEAKQQGDSKWIKRFLNDADNGKFRTFGGQV